jgi:hypothetical protein
MAKLPRTTQKTEGPSMKTTIPMILGGVLLATACRNEQYTMPPTEAPPDDPGQEAIDRELAPDPEGRRTIPEGEAIEDLREEREEEIEEEIY